jgi:hypothetical protein
MPQSNQVAEHLPRACIEICKSQLLPLMLLLLPRQTCERCAVHDRSIRSGDFTLRRESSESIRMVLEIDLRATVQLFACSTNV